jgi:RNA polymerase sigma-70 factor (ECF subfamily)
MKKQPPPSSAKRADEAAAWLQRIAAKGDKAAFIALFDYFAPRVKSYLIRQGLNPPLADDLTQDVMFQVWRRAAQFDESRARASTWIYTIARNRMIDQRRKERSGGVILKDIEQENPAYEPQNDVETASDNARLRQAITKLPPEQRKLIEQSYFDDQSQRDISARTNIPLGTVKSRIRLALARLKDTLKGET